MDKVTRLASENGVVIFSKSSCCICHAVKVLFRDLGVSAVIHEIDQDPDGKEMEKALLRLGSATPVPVVFIGGRVPPMNTTGGPPMNTTGTGVVEPNEVMSLHLSGSLNALLKPYRASN